MIEYYKYGKNEQWGQGLYDFFTLGGGLDTDLTMVSYLPINFYFKYQEFEFPNYFDLLSLYTSPGGGLPNEDYKNITASVSTKGAKITKSFIVKSEYRYSKSDYKNKKVLKADGFRENTPQKIIIQTVSITPQIITARVLLGMLGQWEKNDSNQNNIYGISQSEIKFINNYYDSVQMLLNPYCILNFSEDSKSVFSIALSEKKYSSRPAQENTGIDKKEKMQISSLNGGYSHYFKFNKYFAFTPGYTFIQSESNNANHKTINYNYNAHLITFKMSYEY
jgi:hypothetical protein